LLGGAADVFNVRVAFVIAAAFTLVVAASCRPVVLSAPN
jgi:hypothetical protein